MDMSNFFASVGVGLRNRYLSMAQSVQEHRTPFYQREQQPTIPSEQSASAKDSYDPSRGDRQLGSRSDNAPPSTRSVNDTHERRPAHKVDDHDRSHGHNHHNDHDDHTAAVPSERAGEPTSTYSFSRRSKLDYKLKLQFDLAALTQTAEQIENEETVSLDQLAAAGFGLSADFKLKGKQEERTNHIRETEGTQANFKSRLHYRENQANRFSVQSRNFALDSFFRESTDIRSKFSSEVKDGHSRTVNKFALRYRMDSQFSFAHLNRLNVQTQQVADAAPNALPGYFAAAGSVAEKGTGDMMATFFDAVDSYLGNAEEQMLSKIDAFFTQAAEQLGLSGDMVEMARNHLAGTIEGFFDRVSAAVDQIESNFVTAPEPLPDTGSVATPLPPPAPDPSLADTRVQPALA